jgi:hypothetical protein
MTQKCNWCGFLGAPVEVHGHVQCQQCRTNIDPCCQGETEGQKNITRVQEGMKGCEIDDYILD